MLSAWSVSWWAFLGVLLCVMVKCSYSPPKCWTFNHHTVENPKEDYCLINNLLKTWKIFTLKHHSGYSSMSQYWQQCVVPFLTSLKSCFLSCYIFYQKNFFFSCQMIQKYHFSPTAGIPNVWSVTVMRFLYHMFICFSSHHTC